MIQRRALLLSPAASLAAPASGAAAVWNDVTGDAGYGRPIAGVQQGDALLLRREPDGARTLLRWAWGETIGDVAPPPFDDTAIIAQLPTAASDPLVPVRDAPFWKDPARWLIWREGAVIHAADTSSRRQSVTLDAPPASLLRPALQRDGGPIDVVAIASGRRRVLHMRLSRDGGAPAQVAAIDLPLAASAGCVGFAPGGGVAIGLVGTAPEGPTLMLSLGGHLLRAGMGDMRPLSPPALLMDASGPRLGVVVRSAAGIGLAETAFASGAGVTLTPLGSPGDVREAALVYRPWGSGARAYVVVAAADGRFYRLAPGSAQVAVTPPAAPVRPLVLVPGGHGALLLCCDQRTGPAIVPI